MPGISIRTHEPDEARDRCAEVYFPHRLTVLHDRARFAMSLSATDLGPVSVGLLGYAGEVRLETAELETGYEVNVPMGGRLRTWTGQDEVCATPGLAAVYRPDSRSTLQGWEGGGRLLGLKIDRAALEAELAELVDMPVRSVVRLGPSLDLRRGPGRQWWALARSLTELVRDPGGPMSLPIVARPLAQSLVVALLHAVDHPYRDALDHRPAVPRPAAIRQAVDLLEAEPQTPMTVTDVARRVGLSPAPCRRASPGTSASRPWPTCAGCGCTGCTPTCEPPTRRGTASPRSPGAGGSRTSAGSPPPTAPSTGRRRRRRCGGGPEPLVNRLHAPREVDRL
jgi:hypothetical protein